MSPILLTGFEPFAGASANPSQMIVERLEGTPGLVTAVLPVEYDRAADHLIKLVAEHQPSAVICLGQAEGRTAISVERIAVNLDDTNLADNSGELRVDQAIDGAAASAFFSTLPVKEIVEAINHAGVKASQSLSAGAFVCNHIFFELQKTLQGTSVPSGFIHVPLVPEQSSEFAGVPTMPLDDQVRAIGVALNVVGLENNK